MIIYLDLAVALVGLLVYGFSANPKAAEAGRCAFQVGLLAFLLTVVGSSVGTLLR